MRHDMIDLYSGSAVEHGSLLLSATVAQELQAGQEVQQARRLQQQKLKVFSSVRSVALGCVNTPPTARGSQVAGFTQPRAHSNATSEKRVLASSNLTLAACDET